MTIPQKKLLLILSALIIISDAAYLFCDSKANDFNNDLLLNTSGMNVLFGDYIFFKVQEVNYSSLQTNFLLSEKLGINPPQLKFNLLNEPDAEIKKIIDQYYYTNKLYPLKTLQQIILRYQTLSSNVQKTINDGVQYVNYRWNNGTPWANIEKFFLVLGIILHLAQAYYTVSYTNDEKN